MRSTSVISGCDSLDAPSVIAAMAAWRCPGFVRLNRRAVRPTAECRDRYWIRRCPRAESGGARSAGRPGRVRRWGVLGEFSVRVRGAFGKRYLGSRLRPESRTYAGLRSAMLMTAEPLLKIRLFEPLRVQLDDRPPIDEYYPRRKAKALFVYLY